MAKESLEYAHPELVGGGETTLHSHAGGGSPDFMPYKVYDAVGNQEITETEVTVNLDTEEITNTNYSLAGNEITLVGVGTYQISYTVAIEELDTAGGTRSMVNFWMESDNSGAYTEIRGSFVGIYARETCIDERGGNNATFLFDQSNESKKLRIRAVQPNAAGTNVDTMANRVSVSIIKLDSSCTPGNGNGMWLPTAAAPIHWQWQIGEDFIYPDHLVPNVTVYNIDMFNNSAAVVTNLHNDGFKAIAYISFGTYEDWRPDEADFPESVKGNDVGGWPGEKWLDIRASEVRTIMAARLDLAVTKGYDAVEPDNIDGYTNNTGFPLTYQDQIDYNEWIATQCHTRGLSVGLKNDVDQAADLEPSFDWVLNEECYQYSECDLALDPFINANKAAFQVEYSGTGQCSSLNAKHANSMTRDLDLMSPNFGGYVRTPCIPDTQDTW